MKCEKCGNDINRILINKFLHDGSDSTDSVYIEESEICEAVTFETDANWCGYELSEEEMMDDIRCPHCNNFPFTHKEVQVYEIVRVVCFKQTTEAEQKLASMQKG